MAGVAVANLCFFGANFWGLMLISFIQGMFININNSNKL